MGLCVLESLLYYIFHSYFKDASDNMESETKVEVKTLNHNYKLGSMWHNFYQLLIFVIIYFISNIPELEYWSLRCSYFFYKVGRFGNQTHTEANLLEIILGQFVMFFLIKMSITDIWIWKSLWVGGGQFAIMDGTMK